jgi:hypothetical protein
VGKKDSSLSSREVQDLTSEPKGTDPPDGLEALNSDRLAPANAEFCRFLLSVPKFDDFDIERDPDTGRDIDLSDFV